MKRYALTYELLKSFIADVTGRFFLGLIIVPRAITILDMVAIVELQQSTRS